MSLPDPDRVPPPPQRTCPGRAWLALALAVGGIVAYVLLLGVPWVRWSGAPAFVGLVASMLLASAALRRERRVRTVVPALLSVALALGFVWVFFFVARLPAATTFEKLERAPDVPLGVATLKEHARGAPLLLVFYRGHW